MKKLCAMILACILMLSFVSALAEYDKHIDITASYVDRGSTEIDDMYHFFCDPYTSLYWFAEAATGLFFIKSV